ncbi:MAG: hypothetical protein ONA69_06015 [candidate division KSB1 bacterium]|nr:hypothetical protein [candidate division KSB1 bacterium]MDZ7346337.1 hypothetical protein [candidate division KSB1 bacterium]
MEDHEKILTWFKAWKSAETALQEIRRRELQDEDDYEKHVELLDHMLRYAFEHRAERQTSGLIEQEFWFKKTPAELFLNSSVAIGT